MSQEKRETTQSLLFFSKKVLKMLEENKMETTKMKLTARGTEWRGKTENTNKNT